MDHTGAVRRLFDMAVATYLKQQSDKIVFLSTPLVICCFLNVTYNKVGPLAGEFEVS